MKRSTPPPGPTLPSVEADEPLVLREEASAVCPTCQRGYGEHGAEGGQEELGVGSRIGPYYIQALVGQGGMGRVFKAVHENLQRPVAIKIIRRDQADVDMIQGFLREARAMNRVRHPHVIEVIDIMVRPPWQGDSYYVMEWLEGQSLRDRQDECGRLPVEEVLRIAIDVTSAMEAVHQAGLVHCDLKPDNIYLLERDGRRHFAKIIDFGVVRDRTDALDALDERVAGTPAYMAPEQARGVVDQRSDIYALGVILYEVAVGRLPFTLDGQGVPLTRHVKTPLLRPRQAAPRGVRLPRELERIIMTAMAPGPAKRYQSMRLLRRDLEALLAQRQTSLVRAVWRSVDWRRGARYAVWAGLLLGAWRYRAPLFDLVDPRPAPPGMRPLPEAPAAPAEPLLLEVQVYTKPRDAQVIYQGRLLGITPCVVRLPEGQRELALRRPGSLRDLHVTVAVRAGAEVHAKLPR